MCTKYFAVCICILYLSVETVRALIQDTEVACAELIINCLCLHLDLIIASEVVKLRHKIKTRRATRSQSRVKSKLEELQGHKVV